MSLVRALRLIKFDKLTAEQREDLAEILKVRQQELETALKHVDRALVELAVTPRGKGKAAEAPAKRRKRKKKA